MKKIAVYCGASSGNNFEYAQAARALGAAIGRAGLGIVFGGGENGLMGEVALGCAQEKGEVLGVIPVFLQEKEGARGSLSVLEVVDSMHLRKERIAQLSDAFIALPGGFGTLDELCEVVTWSQLGIHQKPIGILNTRGYFDKFLNFIDHAQNEGFIRGVAKDYFMVESSPDFLLGRITKCLARSV